MNLSAPVRLPDQRVPLSSIISRVIQGGAAFSYQLHKYPASLPVRDVIRRALDLGIRTFGTSPYYDPSEILLGEAFSHPDIANKYTRKDYILMAKLEELLLAIPITHRTGFGIRYGDHRRDPRRLALMLFFVTILNTL